MELWISMGIVIVMLGGALWGVAKLSSGRKAKKAEKKGERRGASRAALTAASISERERGGRRRR